MSDDYSTVVSTLDKMNPEQKKNAVVHAISTLTKGDQGDVATRAGLGSSDQEPTNMIWLVIVITFAITLIVSGCTLVYGVIFLQRTADSVQVVLTVFTSVVGFLAGLLSPSPIQNQKPKP